MKLCRIFCAIILTSYACCVSAADYQIVSDFDDTVKMTNVDSAKAAICNTLLSAKVFGGMPELYRIFKKQGAPVSFVSSGVIHLKFLMFDDMIINKIPNDAIYMRHLISEGTMDFKYSRLVKLLKNNKKPMVLIGDDTQLDPDVFTMFRKQYREQTLAIYIRNVTGRAIPPGIRRFYTPYEIALNEYLENRISAEDLDNIAAHILSVKNVQDLFPDYALCPKSADDFASLAIMSSRDSDIYLQTRQIIDHVLNLCAQRNSM